MLASAQSTRQLFPKPVVSALSPDELSKSRARLELQKQEILREEHLRSRLKLARQVREIENA